MVEQPMHVLVPDRGLVFDAEARLCAAVRGTQTPDLRILVDIYSLDHPVHPEGHLGWWQFAPADAPGELEFTLSRTADGIGVRLNGLDPIDSWINPEVGDTRLVIHVVLRSNATNALLWDEQVPAFASADELAAFRQTFDRNWATPRFAIAPYVFESQSTVHLVSADVFQRDAVGNLALDVLRLLRQNNIPARLFASNADLAVTDLAEPRVTLAAQVRPQDRILYFCSTDDPQLEELAELDCHKTAYFHGITDPAKLRVFDPELAAVAGRGIGRLPLLKRFDQLAANSGASAAVLSTAIGVPVDEVSIIPPLLLPAADRPAPGIATGVDPGTRSADLLTVGQLTPHKKLEDVLRFFGAYLRLSPEARCHIVGRQRNPAYIDYLRWVEATELSLPPGRVIWHGSVPDAELQNLYGSAAALVSMSEDEGFCLPLFEAMGAGLPVLAHGVPAVRETLGRAGLSFGAKQFDHLAQALASVLGDTERRAALVERQLRRHAELRQQMSGLAFLDLVQPDWDAGR